MTATADLWWALSSQGYKGTRRADSIESADRFEEDILSFLMQGIEKRREARFTTYRSFVNLVEITTLWRIGDGRHTDYPEPVSLKGCKKWN